MLKFSLWKKLVITGVLLAATLVALPNFLPSNVKLPAFLPQKTVTLGLDLQGGSHLVLAVDVDEAMKRAYQNLEEEVQSVLRNAADERINYRGLRSGVDTGVHFTIYRAEQVETAVRSLRRRIQGVDVTNEGEGRIRVMYTAQEIARMRSHAIDQTLEILRLRVDEFGVAEPLIQRQGDSRIIIELPGVSDVNRAKDVIGRTALLTFHMVEEGADLNAALAGRVPPGTAVFYEKVRTPSGESVDSPIVLKRRPALTGENLANASSGFDQYGQSSVNITFDARGADRFAQMTRQNVGQRMAIVLDNIVYSAPVLREPILGGRAQITGNFSVTEANDLAMVLRAGALPAPVKIVEERTIGPSLGQDSVDAGRIAVTIGFIAVLLLMVLFYRGFGLAANLALLFNIIFILAIMTLLGATMTLPGIAGIVLTIAMAVDANVIIFERIREESQRGLQPMLAIESGFREAYRTIVDANLTSIIAAAVLFGIGTGPIKGFALTLTIGILASMFTALTLTRLLIAIWFFRARPKVLKV